jgi:hypothetical protein
MAKDDAAASEVVGRDLDRHTVSLKHANAKASHVAAQRREDGVPVGELDAKGGVGEHFGDLALELNRFFFRHGGVGESLNIRQPQEVGSAVRRAAIGKVKKRAISRPLRQ